ncbi:unnamed protein product [marine sediment metagenome]|uniref:Uncharacterized protein n=1 Tax=marine sediment metagenome TaxID=412755 RepID=X0TXR6_9ZZZZ
MGGIVKVQLTKPVKDGKEWKNPGAICDFAEDVARKLIRQHCATALVSPSSDVASGGDGDGATDGDAVEKLTQIEGVNPDIASRLFEAGYKTVQDVEEARQKDLLAIKGIGRKNVSVIQESASDLMVPEDPDEG